MKARTALLSIVLMAAACSSDSGAAGPQRVCEGDYVVEHPDDLSAIADCTTITGDLTVGPTLTSVSLPMLTTVGGDFDVTDNYALTSVSLPMLTAVGSALHVQVFGPNRLTSLSLPALTTVGTFFLDGNDALTSVSLPALVSVGSDFNVSGNYALTSLNVPVLATVGGDFYATNNTMLPNCQAQGIRDQLVSFSGETEVAANDDAATCP